VDDGGGVDDGGLDDVGRVDDGGMEKQIRRSEWDDALTIVNKIDSD